MMPFAYAPLTACSCLYDIKCTSLVHSRRALGVIFLAIVPLMFFVKRVAPHKGAVIVE